MSHARPPHLARRLLALALAYLIVVGSVPASAQKQGTKSKDHPGARPARDAAKAKPAGKSDTVQPLGVNSWTTGGPVGLDRIDQFVVDPLTPATVYAVSDSHNIYKSTNGGATWAVVSNRFALDLVAVRTLAIDPTSPSTLYAGVTSGDPARPDIYKSTDGGATWANISTGIPAGVSTVRTIRLDPVTPSTLYAGLGGVSGVYKSTNSGATWTAANTGLPTSTTSAVVNDIVVDPAAPATLYAGVGANTSVRGVYKSTNGGASWTKTSTGIGNFSVTALRHYGGNTVFAGTTAELYKTTDGGLNWSPSSTGLLNKDVTSFAADTAGALYVSLSGSIIHKSTDGGANWTPLGNGFNTTFTASVAIDPTDANVVYAGTEGTGWDPLESTCRHASLSIL